MLQPGAGVARRAASTAIDALFVFVVAALLLLAALSLETLHTTRECACAAGEGLWPKGQKDEAHYSNSEGDEANRGHDECEPHTSCANPALE
jgi:hypothetical protein